MKIVTAPTQSRGLAARWLGLTLLLAMSAAACAAPQSRARDDGAAAGAAPQRREARSLSMAFRYELTSISPKTAQAASGQMNQLFNAGIAVLDGKGTALPALVGALPRLNSDEWRVYPDGRMEVSYQLRPNLTWHDGQPLTADDFVFAWQVYGQPGLGFFAKPQDQMEEVEARDARTFIIRWRAPYPDAAELALDFVPLPRAILDGSYQTYLQDGDAQGFLNQPYWTTAFVGDGPYRLERWEPGSQLDVVAFDGYALGRPKIDRLIVRIVGDENTVLANMLSEQIQFAMENTMRFEHGSVLKREWGATRRGNVLFHTSSVIINLFQFRQDLLKEPGLLDARVRRSMAYSIDKQALQDGLYEGEGEVAHAAWSPDDRFYDDVNRGVTKYTYDPRQTELLMNESGFSKDREGYFASASGERFRPEFQVLAGTTFERGQAIVTDSWWRAGLQVQPAVMSAVQVRDNLARATFPAIGMALSGGAAFTSAQIGTAANRWGGSNRGGWSSPAYDRLFDGFNTTLDAAERTRQLVGANKLISDELPGLVMYFDVKVLAHTPTLVGPEVKNTLWNLHEWDFR